jgi:hypothetical protein
LDVPVSLLPPRQQSSARREWQGCYLEHLAGEWLMMIAVQAVYFALKKWKQDSAATKRQIGVWQHWKEETEDNDRPLTEVEVERMKVFLRRYAPTSYSEIFAERKADQ